MKTYLSSRLNPAQGGFHTRIAIAFAASRPGAAPRDAFGSGWDDLPEDQRREVAAAWRELQRSEAQLPAAPDRKR